MKIIYMTKLDWNTCTMYVSDVDSFIMDDYSPGDPYNLANFFSKNGIYLSTCYLITISMWQSSEFFMIIHIIYIIYFGFTSYFTCTRIFVLYNMACGLVFCTWMVYTIFLKIFLQHSAWKWLIIHNYSF